MNEPAARLVNADMGGAFLFDLEKDQVALLQLIPPDLRSRQVLIGGLPGKDDTTLLVDPLREP